MSILASLKNLRGKQLFSLGKVLILQPKFIIPTWNATRETIKICDRNFGKEHHKNTPANAFRHALLNFLICQKCYEASGSLKKALEWSKRITDLHEELSPNRTPERNMDLHNNRIGRKLFEKHIFEALDIQIVLIEKMKNAMHLDKLEDFSSQEDTLVYLEK
ncbi:DUF6973 domain-containing protein [Salinimicrobium sp. GXAS 041]|uniref:DUF6973 domain-containing protein n=1 Tax=Salinimicrobium sp. GXAS 041 TaxID=3400806 RepID=UPI003C72D21F